MRNYIKAITKLPLGVKWILITELLYGFAMGIWEVNLNFHLGDSGMTDIRIGYIAGFGALVTALTSILAGELCTRWGYKNGVVAGCFIRAAGIILMVRIPDFIMVGQALFSIGGAFLATAEFPLLTSLVDREYISMVYNLLYCTYQLSMFSGNLFGGFISSGIHSSINSHGELIMICGILFAIMGVGRIFISVPMKEIKREKKDGTNKGSFLRSPMVIWFMVYGLLWGAIENIVLPVSLTNTIYKNSFGFSDSQIGIIFSVATLLSCCAYFIAPVLIERLEQRYLVTALFCSSIILLVSLSFSEKYVFTLLWMGISFLSAFFPGIIESSMFQEIKTEDRGRFAGFCVMFNYLGMSIGAYISGTCLTYFNYSRLMLIGGGILAVTYCIYVYGCKKYLKPHNQFEMNINL